MKKHLQDSFDDSFKAIKLIDSQEIREKISMGDAIKLMEAAYASYSSGKSYVPPRYISDLPGLPMDLFFKPVYSEELGRIAVKILTQKQGGVLESDP